MSTYSRTSRAIAIVTATLGGLVLVGIGTSAAVASIRTTNFTDERGTQVLPTTGITGVEVDSNSSQFTIEFADVSEATLTTEGASRYIWEMRIDENEIVVTSKSSLADFCVGWCAPGNERVTLTLPNALDNGMLSADLTIDAGSMIVAGSYRSLDIEVNAGSVTFVGAARSLETTVNAGRADLTVDGAREADLEVEAGFLTANLTSAAPRLTTVDVSAGTIDLTLPDSLYRVTSDVEAGRFINNLRESPTARNLIDVSVEAGKLTLSAK